MTTADWTEPDLRTFDGSDELRIAVRRPDGSLRPPVPIWVVTAGGRLYVRTWYRRDTGWFGRVLRSGRAEVAVPGLTADVLVDDIGSEDPAIRDAVDAAYRSKYGRYGAGTVDRMVSDDAAAATLRLTRSGEA